jgi:hypothetical protein
LQDAELAIELDLDLWYYDSANQSIATSQPSPQSALIEEGSIRDSADHQF